MTRQTMDIRETDLNGKFKHFLTLQNTDFVFNGDTKAGLKKYMELYRQHEFTVHQKYKEDVVVPNTHNWYIDLDAVNRLNINLLQETK